MALPHNPQPEPPSAFVRIQSGTTRLTVSRCLACGLIVAASPDRRVLQLTEELHRCPVYMNYLPTQAQ